jgi:3-oxoacyl-[acyl-carrier protein] reductase
MSAAPGAPPVPVPTFPDLDGKVAVVTGGSKGIGRAACRMLAANGARIAVVARSADAIDATVAELAGAGAEAIGISADAATASEVEAARERTERELGPVDVLLPFAGGFGAFTPVLDIGDDEWRRVIDDNLTSTFLAVRAFAPGMRERGRGSIVAMSSISGRFLDKTVTASYAAAKAGVLMFIRHAAIELGGAGVRLNAIAPGTTHSERIDEIMDDAALARAAALSPLGRMGTPEDCAAAALFLASDASGWMTGVTLDVSGGRVML